MATKKVAVKGIQKRLLRHIWEKYRERIARTSCQKSQQLLYDSMLKNFNAERGNTNPVKIKKSVTFC